MIAMMTMKMAMEVMHDIDRGDDDDDDDDDRSCWGKLKFVRGWGQKAGKPRILFS